MLAWGPCQILTVSPRFLCSIPFTHVLVVTQTLKRQSCDCTHLSLGPGLDQHTGEWVTESKNKAGQSGAKKLM